VDLSQIGKPCLDWGERTEHLVGPLGKALLALLLTQGLILVGSGRLVSLTEKGKQRFQALERVSILLDRSCATTN
jgi:hypothetical protein